MIAWAAKKKLWPFVLPSAEGILSFLQTFCSASPGQHSMLLAVTLSHWTLSMSTSLLALGGQELSYSLCIRFLLLL